MSFSIEDIFPSAKSGFQNIGFIFGAGTSKKAGYPLMDELTTKVLNKLNEEQFNLISNLVYNNLSIKIDKNSSNPNIEEISDILESTIINTSQESDKQKYKALRDLLRETIINLFLNINNPDIKDHILFFNALKRIFYGRDENIWIFTTNYDLLLESAASYSGIFLSNGFIGSGIQYFHPQSLLFKYGTLKGNVFSPLKEPKIRLIKLHGSLNWWRNSNGIMAYENTSINNNADRIIVLPRKRKIIETLDSPYDQIFKISSDIIGVECKYLVSCGYSFNDQHINETLLLPKLQQSRITLAAFLKDENQNLNQFKNFPSFSFGTNISSKKISSSETKEGTELWQFDKFVELLAKTAGIQEAMK